MKKILVADGVSELGVRILAPHYEVIEEPKCSAERLMQLAPELDAIVVRSASKITAEVIAAAPNLKVIGRAGVGVDNIDLAAATAAGVMVINAPNSNTNAATEHTFALLLALMRHIPRAHASLQRGAWERSKFMGAELKGRTLGLLGCGRIGAAVGLRAQAFEMKVLGYDPYLSAERAEQLGIKLASLDEVLAGADIISMHLPLTDETRGLINAAAIAKMKPGARLINASRGECMVLDDVYAALTSGHLAGAGLDVFEREPLGDHPITQLENVVLTPHLGASTTEAQEGVAVDIATSIDACLRGEPVASALNLAPINAAELERLRPAMKLAKALGFFASHICTGGIAALELNYEQGIAQAPCKMLELAMLSGALANVAPTRINLINATTIAKERNITAASWVKDAPGYAMQLRVKSAGGEEFIAGEIVGERVFIKQIGQFCVSFEPCGVVALLPHDDVPGMIGAVGTKLGDAGINISAMQVGRGESEGENIMAISCSAAPKREVLASVCELPGVHGARVIDCSVLCAQEISRG